MSQSEDLSSIQNAVDALAMQLGRSVAVDNAALELVCASAQIGPIDQQRIQAIIHRAPPLEPVPWMLSHGIATARRPVRLPENAAYGMLPRVCIPIRHDEGLVGYLWLFDTPPVSDDEVRSANLVAAQLAGILHQQDAALDARASEMASLTRSAFVRLRAADAVARAEAARLLPSNGHLAVYAASVDLDEAGRSPDDRQRLQREAARLHSTRPMLIDADRNPILVIARNAAARDDADATAAIHRLIQTTGHRVAALGAADSHAPADLERAAARAHFAADADALLGRGPGARTWNSLGAWRVLFGQPLTAETVASLSPDAQRLIDNGTAEQRVTLLTYLDCARNVTQTCEILKLHRSTLHYRLTRIREIIGDDSLDDGWRAVPLHTALRLNGLLERAVIESRDRADE